MRYIFILTLLGSFFSCTKQQGPVEPIIEVATVSFENDIQPIFDLHCISCHKAASEQTYGGLNLEADKSYVELVNVPAVHDASVKRVVPADAVNSMLWQKINDSGMYGNNMPIGSNSLSQNNQNLIKVWIEEGALDN